MITRHLNKNEYQSLIKIRDLYDNQLPLTVFCKRIFNAGIRHVPKKSVGQTYIYQNVLEKFDVYITFHETTDITKYQEILNQCGKHYTCFLLSIR